MWLLQNPANTVVWLLAALQTLTAPVSLVLDTSSFLQPLSKSIAPKLEAFWILLVVLAIVFGPVHKANILHLYTLPQGFRLEVLAFAAVVAGLLSATSVLIRKLLMQQTRCRVVHD